MLWNHEVDIVSIGSGAATLATAIAAVDGGQTVFVAESAPVDRRSRGRFGIEVSDGETNAYLDAVTEVIGTATPCPDQPRLPVRLLAAAVPVSLGCKRPRDIVEPFVGARLRSWAAECVSTPYGVLYTHVTDRDMTTMRTSAGEKFEAAVVGSVEADDVHEGWSIDAWMSAQARARDVEVHHGSSLERLVFDYGRVVGVVVRTTHGTCAVSARRGVALAVGSGALAGWIPDEAPVRVSVVSKTASRFGRIELLARERAGNGRADRAVTGPRQHHRLRSQPLNPRGGCQSLSPGQLHDGTR